MESWINDCTLIIKLPLALLIMQSNMIGQNILRLLGTSIKEKLQRGLICIPYVTTQKQVADILNKGLSKQVCQSLNSKLGTIDIFKPA